MIRYPQFREQSDEAEQQPSPKRRGVVRRSLSFADDPNSETDVVFAPAKRMQRSMTLATVTDVSDEKAEPVDNACAHECLIPTSQASDFHVLRLDLKLGAPGSASSPAALVSQLEKASIANLLDERIAASTSHVDKLRARIQDTASKVLVTGDLNAGKSTFVNALLRREVMPVDQQPCTTAFCEVHDAAENGGIEEVHLLKDGPEAYSVADEATYTRAKISDLEDIVGENEDTGLKMKIYLRDTSSPAESLLNNGVVDISLIDAPGLNRDNTKTTAVFARQEEIDVVVFVVSAENHFTLSAKEFLWNASLEKAYVFVVVNKYAGIRDKAKCRRLVLEQIKQLSPRTYEAADELVHFVDSAVAASDAADPSFTNLQTSLRSFVLEKREQSKLAPASTYLSHLLSDVELLVGSNAILAQVELDRAKEDLNRARPVLEKMKKGRETLEDGLEAVEEEGAGVAGARTKQVLDEALTLVSQGKPGVDKTTVRMPSYPGLLDIWDYITDVRRALLASVDAAVKQVEDEARVTTVAGVDAIAKMGKEHLPEGTAESKRVFMPEAMFSARAVDRKKTRRVSGGVMGPMGVHSLGLGLAQRSELLEANFLDLFDVHHQFWVHFGSEDEDAVSKGADEEVGPTALSVISVGLGALTMVGGKAMGARGLIEGVFRVSDLFASPSARKWAAPLVGACAIGATVYFVLELPQSIPRNVGRRIRRELLARPEGADEQAEGFVEAHAGRVSRETRKVLRLASWDLKERFRGTMDERAREVKGAEESERKSRKALDYFRGVERQTGEVREAAGLVSASL